MKFKATVINVGAYPDMRIQGYERIKHSTMQVVGDVIVLSVSEGYHAASISAQNREQFWALRYWNQAHYRPGVPIETGTDDGSDGNCGSSESLLICPKRTRQWTSAGLLKNLLHCVGGHASKTLSCLKVRKIPRKLKPKFSQILYGGWFTFISFELLIS